MVAQLVPGEVVDVFVVLGPIDAGVEIVSQPLAGAVVICVACVAFKIPLPSEAQNLCPASVAKPLDI